ncbi:uncharacterized protein LOC121726168 [Aricia agestis]|uniref:uncharacterized protein LOC121726168 n=1 Tax=Aricia agestis TaxID=91739 RepID=UPI001C20BD96|nr:uncharacterized protein LOC121726168 [Aricia agestis]
MRFVQLAVLPLLLRARAEWVEITQNTYRRNSLRKPSTAELTPEYPNATLGGSDWHGEYVHRAGDVRRVPAAPRRPAPAGGGGAADDQEYYDIDGPDELNVHDEVPSSEQDPPHPGPDYTVKLNLDNEEGNRRVDTRGPSLESGPGGNFKQSQNPQPTRLTDVQRKYQKKQSVDRDRKREPSGEDHLNLNKIMQHFIDALRKQDERIYNESKVDRSKTKDVELDIRNTVTQAASFGDSSHRKDSEEHTNTPKDLDNSKHFPGIWRMLKNVANVISKNTHRTVNGKIKYLEDLKNKLLFNIQERIDSVWPAAGRVARGAEARGDMELPSSEGALMTISFLTFAVFLIKLVLQIIHTYKNKTMMTPAVVTAVGRAAAATLVKN